MNLERSSTSALERMLIDSAGGSALQKAIQDELRRRAELDEHDAAFPGITAEDFRLELSNALWEESRRSDDALSDAQRQELNDAA